MKKTCAWSWQLKQSPQIIEALFARGMFA